MHVCLCVCVKVMVVGDVAGWVYSNEGSSPRPLFFIHFLRRYGAIVQCQLWEEGGDIGEGREVGRKWGTVMFIVLSYSQDCMCALLILVCALILVHVCPHTCTCVPSYLPSYLYM